MNYDASKDIGGLVEESVKNELRCYHAEFLHEKLRMIAPRERLPVTREEMNRLFLIDSLSATIAGKLKESGITLTPGTPRQVLWQAYHAIVGQLTPLRYTRPYHKEYIEQVAWRCSSGVAADIERLLDGRLQSEEKRSRVA